MTDTATLSTTGNEIDPEGIDHPRHYNTHPSGVECIEIKRYLPSNLADAFKYVFRRDEKGDAIKNLNKAVWYLRDEITHLNTEARYRLPHKIMTLLGRVVQHEPEPKAADFYEALMNCLVGENQGRREPLIDCLIAALRLSCLYCEPQPPLEDL